MSAALMVTELFRDKIRRLGVDILTVQDALLIHDLAESDPRVTDRTPHDVYDPESHKKMEERVIREILAYDPRLIELWLNYEYGRTPE
jgi:5'-deoxynucleotidase YfbR-like HD superfamily hydrolase